jgi:hypothetical protein
MRSALLVLLAAAACGEVKNDTIDGPAGDPDAPTTPIDAPVAPMCDDGVRVATEVCFAAPQTLIGTDVTYDARLADTDGDGDLDVVYLIGDQFYMNVNSGNGVYASSGIPGATTNGEFLAAHDVNGDGRADLVLAADDAMEYWRSDAAQTFVHNRAGRLTSFTGQQAGGVVFADLDGAAPPEQVALFSSQLVVGVIDGSQNMTTGVGVGVNSGQVALAVGRYDEDNRDDVLVGGGNGVLLYRGAANTFLSVLVSSVTTPVIGVASGDVDGDGKTDAFFAEATGVGVARGAGAGAFLAPSRTNLPGARRAMDAADIDGDGNDDLVVGVSTGGSFSLQFLRGQDDGTLAAPVSVPLPVEPDSVHFDGDINGDGSPDLIVTNVNFQTILVFSSSP